MQNLIFPTKNVSLSNLVSNIFINSFSIYASVYVEAS